MENIENKSAGTKGGIFSIFKSNSEGERNSSVVDGQREDSIGGAGEEQRPDEVRPIDPEAEQKPDEAEKTESAEEKVKFPIELENPGGIAFKHYGNAAQDFQRKIIASRIPDIEALTITKMTVPTVDAPDTHITPYCGFPVVKGDIFSVQLSNGTLITA